MILLFTFVIHDNEVAKSDNVHIPGKYCVSSMDLFHCTALKAFSPPSFYLDHVSVSCSSY